MKTRKFSLAQILTFVLAFVLTFAMAVPAFAAEDTGPTVAEGKTLIKVLPSEGANTEFANRFQAYAIFTGRVENVGDTAHPGTDEVPLYDLRWSTEFESHALDFIKFLNSADINAGNVAPFKALDTSISESTAKSSATATQVAKVLQTYAKDSEFVISFAKAVYKFITDNSITGTVSQWYKRPTPTPTEGYWYFEVDNPGYYLIIDNYGSLRQAELDKEQKTESDKYPAEVSGFILAVLGNQFVNMKSKTPEVEKDIVLDESAGTTSKGDTVALPDTVTFKLTGTLPENYNQFDRFTYTFRDTLSKGLQFVEDSAKVYAVKADDTSFEIKQTVDKTINYDVITPQTDPATKETKFNVNFPDLKTLKAGDGSDLNIDEFTQIIVTYKATVTEDAVIGSLGNPNTVDLEFSNNPFTDGKGDTTDKKVYVYSFGLEITKYADDVVDEETGKPTNKLPGAEFVLIKDGEYATFEGATGTKDNPQKLSGWVTDLEDATKLVSDSEGKIYVSGLDVGTYTLKETKAPDGYNTMKDLVITITAELNPDGSLKSVSKKVEGVDAEPVVYTASSDTAINGIFENGMLPIDPVNNKAPVLPGTGGIGLVIFYVLGGLLLVGAATYIIVSGRKKNKQQQQ